MPLFLCVLTTLMVYMPWALAMLVTEFILIDFYVRLFWRQGVIIFHNVFDHEPNVGGFQVRVEGVYVWPFRQLRMVASR